MAKQMSLADLAKNSKSVTPPQHNVVEDTIDAENDIKENVMAAEEKPMEVKSSTPVVTPHDAANKPGKGHKSNDTFSHHGGGNKKFVSPSSIVAAGIKSGKIKPKEEEPVEDSPILTSAFKAMTDRIERSKHDIDTIMMPIVMENAKELAMEQQMAAEGQSVEDEASEVEERPMSQATSPFNVDPKDFEELEDDVEMVADEPKEKPHHVVAPKVDPSEQEYDFDSLTESNDDDGKDEDDNPIIENEVEEDMPENPMPNVSESAAPEKPDIKLPTQEELDNMGIENEEAPVEEKKPEPKPIPVNKPKINNIPEPAPKPVADFHIESEDAPKIEVGKRSPMKNDMLVDMDGNQVSIAKAMEELDRSADGEPVDDEIPETREEIEAKFKKMFEHTKIIKDPVDLSKFKIRKKPVGSAYILNDIQNKMNVKKADWGLYFTHRAERYTECIGPELDNLRKTMGASNNINSIIASIRFIYDHVDDSNKPDFDSWCKVHRTEDINSQYFGIYRATYSDTNLIPRTCVNPKCKKTSLIETNIDDMVVYGEPNDDHEAIKKEFMDICRGDTTTSINPFKATLMQISENFAVAYSPASLYNTFIQYSTLKDTFTAKYSDLLDMLAHVDTFFLIDRHTGELIPIAIKEYPDNLTKTVMSRIQTFSSILTTLTLDQYNTFNEKMDRIVQKPKISYRFPKVICPECGKEIPEAPIEGMLQILFMRAQLARIKSL